MLGRALCGKCRSLLAIALFSIPICANALDVECEFSGERRPTLFYDLVSGENISFTGGVDDNKKEVYWGDDYITIIVESIGIATLYVIDRKDFSATKRITRAGITRGEVRGTCKIREQQK